MPITSRSCLSDSPARAHSSFATIVSQPSSPTLAPAAMNWSTTFALKLEEPATCYRASPIPMYDDRIRGETGALRIEVE